MPVARDSHVRAIAFSEELYKAILARAEMPLAGKQEEFLRPGILWFPHGDYVFYYRALPANRGIRVLHVFHGARRHRAIMAAQYRK